MIRIDKQLLQEVGLGALSEADQSALLGQIMETLELRVGKRLADQMTEAQLEEFDNYYKAKDEQGAYKWLETNFPNYKEIVQQEFDGLKKEVTMFAPQILTASNSNFTNNPIQSQIPPSEIGSKPFDPTSAGPNPVV